MSLTMKFAFIMAATIMSCYGQLSFHNDANTNSFTVKAPGSQQSFTRYFGGQQGALLQQQQLTAQSSQLQQQVHIWCIHIFIKGVCWFITDMSNILLYIYRKPITT